MSTECHSCRDNLQHCHGTVIRHSQSRAECTEADCAAPEVLHAFSVDCDSIGCSCDQALGDALAI
jgi:hypothetical protein